MLESRCWQRSTTQCPPSRWRQSISDALRFLCAPLQQCQDFIQCSTYSASAWCCFCAQYRQHRVIRAAPDAIDSEPSTTRLEHTLNRTTIYAARNMHRSIYPTTSPKAPFEAILYCCIYANASCSKTSFCIHKNSPNCANRMHYILYLAVMGEHGVVRRLNAAMLVVYSNAIAHSIALLLCSLNQMLFFGRYCICI